MTIYVEAAFDVKCTNLLANQDAGSLTKGDAFKNAECSGWSAVYVELRFGVDDITTFGGGAFRDGQCLGWLVVKYAGSTFYYYPQAFSEVKSGGNAYYRFLCPPNESFVNFPSR